MPPGYRLSIIDHHALILTLIAHFRPFNPVEENGAGVNLGLVALLHSSTVTVTGLPSRSRPSSTLLPIGMVPTWARSAAEAADRFPVEGGDNIAGFNAPFAAAELALPG